MEKFSMIVLLALLTLVGLAQADTAATPADSQADVPPGLVVGQVATVQGVVRFEEHHTIIPLFVCPSHPNVPCVSSRPYWSLVLDNDAGEFEIDQRFALDQTTVPSAIEIAGQTLHWGQLVRVEATVEYAGTGYAILGNVRNVDPVSEYQTLSLPNWRCHGVVDPDTEIEAQVWSMGMSGGTEGPLYALHLNGAEGIEEGPGRRLFPLAALSDAQGFTSRNQLVYRGEDVNANVQLVIDAPGNSGVSAESGVSGESGGAPVSGNVEQVPGHLHFALAELPAEHTRIHANGDFPVVCEITR